MSEIKEHPNLQTALIYARMEFMSLESSGKSHTHIYSTIADLRKCYEKALLGNGVTLTHYMIKDGTTNEDVLITRLKHAKTGECDYDSRYMHYYKNTHGAKGEAQSYARRYAIQALLGLPQREEEDDDGAKEEEHYQKKNKKKAADPPIINKSQLDRFVELLATFDNAEELLKKIKGFHDIRDVEKMTVVQWDNVMNFLKKL